MPALRELLGIVEQSVELMERIALDENVSIGGLLAGRGDMTHATQAAAQR